MIGDTLQCGHPARFRYRHPSVGYGCIACHQTPIAIRRYAGELCGIVVTESDPIEFAKAIVDDPNNRLPRLVFADWLDEQGDPRGELIRVEAEIEAECKDCPFCGGRQLNREGKNCTHCYCECDDPSCQLKTSLRKRRTALRRQLGYDQPAEQTTKTVEILDGPERGKVYEVEFHQTQIAFLQAEPVNYFQRPKTEFVTGPRHQRIVYDIVRNSGDGRYYGVLQ